SDIQRLILGQGAKMALAGVVLGVFLALGLTHLMSSQLFGITPHDPLTFAAVALILLLVSLGACYLPARRAMGVDPMVALRHEGRANKEKGFRTSFRAKRLHRLDRCGATGR